MQRRHPVRALRLSSARRPRRSRSSSSRRFAASASRVSCQSADASPRRRAKPARATDEDHGGRTRRRVLRLATVVFVFCRDLCRTLSSYLSRVYPVVAESRRPTWGRYSIQIPPWVLAAAERVLLASGPAVVHVITSVRRLVMQSD